MTPNDAIGWLIVAILVVAFLALLFTVFDGEVIAAAALLPWGG